MGNCCTFCKPKCFPHCGKQRSDGKGTQASETASTVLNCTSTPIEDANGFQTFQEFVDCFTEQSEKRQKTDASKKKQGSLARCLARITCCKLFRKQPDTAFWIETPQGYLERRCEDI